MKDEKLEKLPKIEDDNKEPFEKRYPDIKKSNENTFAKMKVLVGLVRTKTVPDVNTIRKATGMNYYTCKKWKDTLERIPVYAPLGSDKQRETLELLIKQAKIMVKAYETVTVPDEAYDDPLPDDIVREAPMPVMDEDVIDVSNLAFDYEKVLTDADLKKFKEFKKEDDDEYEEIDFSTRYQKK